MRFLHIRTTRIKGKVTEASNLVAGVKEAIAEQADFTGLSNTTTLGADAMNAALNTSISGNYVSSVTAAGTGPLTATITVLFKPASATVPAAMAGNTIVWTGTHNGGSVSWLVTGGTLAPKYLPKG